MKKKIADQAPAVKSWRIVEDGILPLAVSLKKFWEREHNPPTTQRCYYETNCPSGWFGWAITLPGLNDEIAQFERVRLWLQRNGFVPDAQELERRLEKTMNELCKWETRVRAICPPSNDLPPKLPGKMGMAYWAILNQVHSDVAYLEDLALALKEKQAAPKISSTLGKSSRDPSPGLDKEAEALGLLAKHPDWTKKRMADAIGVHRSTLDRWPRFTEARKIARRAYIPPKGYKTTEGSVEAYDE